MQCIRKPLRTRTGFVAFACAGLLAGGAGAAHAAPSTPRSGPHTAGTASPSPGKASITLQAKPSSVKAGQPLTLTGTAKGLKSGDKLTLERKGANGAWQKLTDITTPVSGGKYVLQLKINKAGTETLRFVHGATASPAVKVTVS